MLPVVCGGTKRRVSASVACSKWNGRRQRFRRWGGVTSVKGWLAWGLLWILVFGTGCPSGVGSQSDPAPVAVAAALGVGTPVAGTYQVRAASEVQISGKDSDSEGVPVLEYEWTQVGGPPVQLFERNTVTRSFTAPSEAATLEFELTVTDADGMTAVDSVTIDVVPVLDESHFLRDPSVEEELVLFVSPNLPGPTVAATIPYTISVTPTVYWTDRDGSPRSQVLDPVLSVTDQLDAGFVIPSDPVDATQDRITLPVPLLDADEVNVFFQGADRAGRLELEEVLNARVELEVALVGSGDFQVHVGRSNGASFDAITGSDVFVSGVTPLPSGAILDGASGSVRLDLEKVRQAVGAESFLSASNYYACLDPTAQTATLSGWLARTGFVGANDVVNARYVNNYDLGFGRDMYTRTDPDGSVYSYVVNYPTLEALLKGQGEFATVAMEYSAKPEGNCDAPTASATEKIVKFFAFVPDTTTGEMVRAESMNFDGRGERFLPGVCTACHDGSITNIAALGQASLAAIPASNVDLSATFMPWDVDSLLYARAADASLVDPSLNAADFTEAELEAASLESQQAALRALNESALATYVGDLRRYEEPLRMIHGWYGNQAALPAPIVDDLMTIEDETDDLSLPSPLESASLATLTTLPAVDFDGSYVQPGWVGEEEIYHEVFARYCRMCHTQQDNLDRNFEGHEEFLNAANLSGYVFERGIMPAARLTLDRFWVDFGGDFPGAAETLRQHLIDEGIPVSATGIPGNPQAAISLAPSLVETIDGAGDLVATTINLDGTGSLFAENYDWQISDDSGCGSTPVVLGAGSPQASFVVERSPCQYTVSLEVEAGLLSDTVSTTVNTNRNPATVDFVAATTGYASGDAVLDIDVLGQISAASDGDGSLVLIVNDPNPPYSVAVNSSVSDLGSGWVRHTLDSRLGGTNDSFQYQIEDLNGSLSTTLGVVSVSIAAIAPMLSTQGGSLSESGVTLEWAIPAGFAADQYSIFRDGPTPDGSYSVVGTTLGTSFADSGLVSGENYNYQVRAELFSETSLSNVLGVSTTVGVPTGLMGSVGTNSVSLSWSAGPGSAPDSYTIYRGGGILATTAGGGSTAYVDNTVGQNTSYTYEVSQTRNGVESARSNSAGFTTNTGAPTGFTADEVNGESDEVDLAWSAPAGGTPPSSYNLYRDGSFIANVMTTTYVDDDALLGSNTTYSYQVGAVGTNGESARDADSATTNLSLQDLIAASGTSSATTDAGSYPQGCLTSGCHLGNDDATMRSRFEQPCASDDADMGDCTVSMAGITIGTNLRNLIILWNAAGAPD